MEETMNNTIAAIIFGFLVLAVFVAVLLAVKQKTGVKGAAKNLAEILDEIYENIIVICALVLALFGKIDDGIFFMTYAVYLILHKKFKNKNDKEICCEKAKL